MYVVLPNYNFPQMLPDSIQSFEPADIETPLRRGYYTNMTRGEVLDWYKKQFEKSSIGNIPMPTYLLNYPPEESQTIIRDQARSTFLQQIVHPMRETIFINGYEPAPTDDANKIVVEGKKYRQKIIVRFVPTSLFIRGFVALLSLIALPVVVSMLLNEASLLFRSIFKNSKK